MAKRSTHICLSLASLVLMMGAMPSFATTDDDRVELAKDILSLTADVTCDSDSQCKSVGLGDKPCGGFQEYRVYSLKSVDEPALLRKIDDYNRLDKENNLKNNKVSTCEFLMQPTTSCMDNQCMAAPAHTPPLLK